MTFAICPPFWFLGDIFVLLEGKASHLKLQLVSTTVLYFKKTHNFHNTSLSCALSLQRCLDGGVSFTLNCTHAFPVYQKKIETMTIRLFIGMLTELKQKLSTNHQVHEHSRAFLNSVSTYIPLYI